MKQRTWCIAKPSSDEATLLANINYACSQVDCRVMQKGCPCFSPDNLINHASIAMNLYFRSKGCNLWNCDFRGSGLLVITDPSKLFLLHTKISPNQKFRSLKFLDGTRPFKLPDHTGSNRSTKV